jgi:predicted dehydrogenase
MNKGLSKSVAVIGAGQWGRNLVRTFHALGALEEVAEASPAIRADLGAKYPDVRWEEDAAAVLASDVRAVVIATPVPTHYALAREALLAGKDVFVEKPLTMNAEEAEKLQELAESTGRILMVGHLLLYQPAIRWIKAYLDAGELGELHALHQQRLKLGRVRAVENVLWSLGVHDVAVLLDLVGAEPEEIAVSGHSILQKGIEDDVHLHLSFAGGVQEHLHTSWLWPQQERRLVAVGSKGMLVYDELTQKVTLHRKTVGADLVNVDEGSEVVFEGEAEPLRLECLHFLECMERRMRPLSDGASGVAVLRVLEKAMEQMGAGRQGAVLEEARGRRD